LEKSGLINDYMVLPYDWRIDFKDVIKSGIDNNGKIYYSLETNSPFITKEIDRMIENSANGKVTIVAHSMGGLITKTLLSDWEQNVNEENTERLQSIENVILVASPQLGTPKAIPALLHGFDQALLKFGFTLEQWKARELSRNMPSAYNLLPSSAYFERVKEIAGESIIAPEVILFDESLKLLFSNDDEQFISAYGNVIDSFDVLQNFINGVDSEGNVIREEQRPQNIRWPINANENLLSNADDVHSGDNGIDDWQPPAGIKVTQVAGWGKDTIAGVTYYAKKVGTTKICNSVCTNVNGQNYIFDYNADLKITSDGDETVVLPSAIAMEKDDPNSEEPYMFLEEGRDWLNTYYVDLTQQKKEHGTIMESDSVRI
jgi:pimeloyl-ACP methyl ester carboxylesterase